MLGAVGTEKPAKEMKVVCGKVPLQEAMEFEQLAKTLGLTPSTMVRGLVRLALRLAREVSEDELIYLLLAEGDGGEKDG